MKWYTCKSLLIKEPRLQLQKIDVQVFTIGLVLIFNVGGLGIIVLFSLLLVEGPDRVTLVGWICAAINIAVFAAPLSIMVYLHCKFARTNIPFGLFSSIDYVCINLVVQKQVIQTKSVEFMPFTLSFFLTLCATMWFFYGFFVKDYYIAVST